MSAPQDKDQSQPDEVSREREARVARANEMYRQACKEMGIKFSSWEDFSAWQQYVEGKINEGTLAELAGKELGEFSSTFGKYLVIQKEDPAPREETGKKERAKEANKIYQDVCTEGGLTVCFFQNFSAWSDYVEGKIDDSDFRDKAKLELDKVKEENR